jgi:MoaA/NifB/PqqE/SkfB family radical SAM enzyme
MSTSSREGRMSFSPRIPPGSQPVPGASGSVRAVSSMATPFDRGVKDVSRHEDVAGQSWSMPKASISWRELLTAWARIVSGRVPLLSIEITKECPLRCPGCYAYGDTHLGGEVTLRELNDLRGDALVQGVLALVRRHKPMHVSLVGGEPLMRHRELSCILPALSGMRVFTLVVTSGVIPIPLEWMKIARLRVAVSVDGLPEDHDLRRAPATYARILKNIQGREVNIHWVITRPMLRRSGYLEEYLAFWSAQTEVNRIWVSLYSPQVGEQSPERLSREEREFLAQRLAVLALQYPKLLMNQGIAASFIRPPQSPDDCLFAKMSANVSADLRSRVEPCVFGGTPECSECGCAISSGLHWIRTLNVVAPLTINHFIAGSIGVGRLVNRIRLNSAQLSRWVDTSHKSNQEPRLVQIEASRNQFHLPGNSTPSGRAAEKRWSTAAVEPARRDGDSARVRTP